MKKPIVLAAVVVLVAAGSWGIRAWQQRSRRDNLTLYGNVDIREVNLGFRVSGRVARVEYEEGDEVHCGDVLARLDEEPNQREVNEARAQVASLQAHLGMLQAGYRPQEIAQARALVREREATTANALRIYQRKQQLLSANAVSVQERDDAEADYNEAEARLKSAREQLALQEAGYRTEEIEQARADLARAEAALSSAQLRLDDTVLKSPCNGVVLTRAQEPGAMLASGTTVLTVSLREPVWVRAYVPETDLGRLHPGMKVQVFTDAQPARPYAGQIGYISPRSEFTPKNVETADLRTSLVYRLRIVVERPDEGLRQGMPVTAILQL